MLMQRGKETKLIFLWTGDGTHLVTELSKELFIEHAWDNRKLFEYIAQNMGQYNTDVYYQFPVFIEPVCCLLLL